jgi:hypothetical protein
VRLDVRSLKLNRAGQELEESTISSIHSSRSICCLESSCQQAALSNQLSAVSKEFPVSSSQFSSINVVGWFMFDLRAKKRFVFDRPEEPQFIALLLVLADR